MKNAPMTAKSRGRVDTAAGAAKSTRSRPTVPLTPRLQRLARALLRGPQTVRCLMDEVPTNNVPEYIRTLRGHGLAIPCEQVRFTTADGTPSWHGRYTLTDGDREKLQSVIDGGGQ